MLFTAVQDRRPAGACQLGDAGLLQPLVLAVMGQARNVPTSVEERVDEEGRGVTEWSLSALVGLARNLSIREDLLQARKRALYTPPPLALEALWPPL